MESAKHIEELVDRFVQEETATMPNPFMTTRIMAAVGKSSHLPLIQPAPAWRMVMAAFVLALAVFAGVAAGNLYNTGNTDNTAMLINDDAMEHFGFYTAAADE